MAAQDGGPLALAMANINKEFGLTEKAPSSPLATAMNNVNKAYGLSAAPVAATATSQTMPVSAGDGMGIVDLGRGLQGLVSKLQNIQSLEELANTQTDHTITQDTL